MTSKVLLVGEKFFSFSASILWRKEPGLQSIPRYIQQCTFSTSQARSQHFDHEWFSPESREQSSNREKRKKRITQALQIGHAPEHPLYDWAYLTDPSHRTDIRQNIENRKGTCDIDKICSLYEKLQNPAVVNVDNFFQDREKDVQAFSKQLYEELLNIPNSTHPDVPIGDESHNRVIEECGAREELPFTPKDVVTIGEELRMLRTRNLGYTSGQRSYYFMGDFAKLEKALIKYTVDYLTRKGYQLMLIPDLIHPSVVDGCGFKSSGPQTQVYKLNPHKHGKLCLSGTGEMPLAAYFTNAKLYAEDLPRRIVTVSRCYRAETAAVEKGIYRVHQFYKVEMFCVTTRESGEESERMHREIVAMQNELFTSLQLHFRILDMASEELGAPAYRKFDIEAWMPAQKFWGEISSASNCTDFQARRLNIQYMTDNGQLNFVHTVNGTACALPRTIMAIVEQNQLESGGFRIPTVLQPYMQNKQTVDAPLERLHMKYNKLSTK